MGGANWLTDIVRTFLSLFDRMVYWFIGLLISLFDQLATVQLFDDNIIGEFSKRIFFLVSVVMIFKVSFSIVKYIINPDTFSDKERGMGKVIQNVILVLVCLAGIGQVFTWAYDLQKRILSNHVIEKVILGVDNGVTEEEQINSKNRIPFNLLSAFITPNTTEIPEFSYDSDVGVYVCNNSISMYNVIGDGRTSYNGDNGDSWTCNTGKCATGFGGCLNTISSEKPQSKKVVTTDKRTIVGSTGEMFNEAYHSYNYALLLDLINDRYNDSTIYLFEYKFIISTVAGIFVAIMYLNFCIDLAVRAVKFGFLQLIAPIPIISMIDPKSSKSGMMSKWVKNCMNTYLGLFIRIAVVNFVVYIVNLVFSNKASIPGGEVGVFVQIVILFGALMFAKQAPKLLSDLTGIDLKGDFKMNALSRIPGIKVANKLGGAALTGAVGGIGGAVAAGIATGKNGKNAGAIIGSSMMGLGRGIFGGMKSGYAGGVKGVVGKTGQTISGIGNRYTKYGSSTVGDRIGSKVKSTFGLQTEADNQDKIIDMMKESSDAYNAMDSYMEKEILKNKDGKSDAVVAAKNAIDMIGAVDREQFFVNTTDAHGRVISRTFDQTAYENAVQEQAKLKAEKEQQYYKVLKARKQSYFDDHKNDAQIQTNLEIINKNQEKIGNSKYTKSNSTITGYVGDSSVTFNQIDDYNKALRDQSATIKTNNSMKYSRKHDARNSTGSK